MAGLLDSGSRISDEFSPFSMKERWSRQAVKSMTKSDLICSSTSRLLGYTKLLRRASPSKAKQSMRKQSMRKHEAPSPRLIV